ncbi:hypothetical protein BDV95DRAFT_639094, partial [Massariosphaeria phaeospora]
YRATHKVDLGKIIFKLSSKDDGKPLEGRLLLEPREDSTWARPRRLMVLDFHTIEGRPSEWAAFHPAPQVHMDVLSDRGIQQLSAWIEDCVENHALCNAATKKVQPTRLLHVTVASDPTRALVRLHRTEPLEHYKFVAPSHCWARTKPIKTTSDNLQERMRGIA